MMTRSTRCCSTSAARCFVTISRPGEPTISPMKSMRIGFCVKKERWSGPRKSDLIHAVLLNQRGEMLRNHLAAGRADNISDEKYAHWILREERKVERSAKVRSDPRGAAQPARRDAS